MRRAPILNAATADRIEAHHPKGGRVQYTPGPSRNQGENMENNICQYCGAHLGPGEVCSCVLSEYDLLTPEDKRKVDSFAFALVDAQSRVRDIELTEDERKFLNQFHKADAAEKIVTVAIMCSGSEEDGLDMVEGYTRSDFKRANAGSILATGLHPSADGYVYLAEKHCRCKKILVL